PDFRFHKIAFKRWLGGDGGDFRKTVISCLQRNIHATTVFPLLRSFTPKGTRFKTQRNVLPPKRVVGVNRLCLHPKYATCRKSILINGNGTQREEPLRQTHQDEKDIRSFHNRSEQLQQSPSRVA